MGVISSHIGFESTTGKDNWTLTRSIVAENSPYFESGGKLSDTADNGKLMVAAFFVLETCLNSRETAKVKGSDSGVRQDKKY